MRVVKLRPDGSESFSWNGNVLRRDHEELVLRAPFNVPHADLGYTVWHEGDVFVEFYYWNRWYNVFQVFDPSGTLKGWYCNVATPPSLDVERDELRYVDLDLDLWVPPEGDHLVLDEEDYRVGVAVGKYSPEQVDGAERGWRALLEIAASRDLPSLPFPG